MQPKPTTIDMRKTALIAIFVLTGWAKTLCAQSQCTVTHYDEFSGMAQWYVTQIEQDQQGMLWFATWNGLNRYDGYEFTNFKSRVGDGIDMPSDRIRDIMLAKDGNLRCLVDNQILGFSTKTYKFYHLPEQELKSQAAIFEERRKRDKAFYSSKKPNIYKDVYDTEWVISQDGKIMYKNPATGELTAYPAKLEGAENFRLCLADRMGNAWFVSSYGVFKLSFNRKPFSMFEQHQPTQVRFFYVDRKQRYWITTRDDATVRLYDRNNHLLGYLGKDGNLHSQYTQFGAPVYHIMQDSKGNYWLSSKPHGLFRVKETTNGKFAIENFAHNPNDKNSIGNDNEYWTVEDKLGRLWVATFDGGLNCIPNPQAEHLQFLHCGNSSNFFKNYGLRTRQLHITRGNILMVATTEGLFIADISPRDPRKIVFHRHVKDKHRSSSLSNNATMYIAEDKKHRLYVCTESGGVNQITSENLLANKLEFRHFNTSNGFPSDVALSAVANDSNMLVVSNNQIIMLTPDSEQPAHETYFGNYKLRFSDATPTVLPDGRTIFGLQNGAFAIRRNEIKKSVLVPPIALTGLSIEDNQTLYSINRQDTLTLNPDERNIILRFAALDYSQPDQISYAFRMGGYSDTWRNIGHNRSIPLLDLDPGTYQLQIRSTNNDGVWVDNVRTLTIIVKPTFWETRWAQLLYAVLFALLVWGLLRTRRYIIKLKRNQQQLHEAYLELLNNGKEKPAASPAETTEQPSKPTIKAEDELFMQKAMKFIEEHIGDSNINIGDMAEATATSRSVLHRKMKTLLGVTPLDFIREARIRKACQMLKDGASVNDVAYNCGFSDPKYFAKCFKSEIGITPKEYKVENSTK